MCTPACALVQAGAMLLTPGRETDPTCATRASPSHGPALVFCPDPGPVGGGRHPVGGGSAQWPSCIVSKREPAHFPRTTSQLPPPCVRPEIYSCLVLCL